VGGTAASPHDRNARRSVEGPGVRVVFVTYWVVILFGIVLYLIVGLVDR
jgi:hypothetical protein